MATAHEGGVVMALEEQVIEWAASRPAWQRKNMARVAAGAPLSDEECDQLIAELLAAQPTTDDAFGLEQLPQGTQSASSVTLASISGLNHVNALESETPLTFEASGITVVYGDNGSGKSGYARLLKRIARSRHQEEVLSDVFRDTAVSQPEASVTVRVGTQEQTISWPHGAIPELKRMVFFDSSCRDAYIASESDFPYRPPTLFVMEGLIAACLTMRTKLDAQLDQNARTERDIPIVDPSLAQTEIGRCLISLSGSTSPTELDRLITTAEPKFKTIDDFIDQERLLSTADVAGERLRLNREAEKLDAVRSHLELLASTVSAAELAQIPQERAAFNTLEGAASLAAQGFVSELPGTGGTVWKELWEAARRYSSIAYPGDAFPVVHDGVSCVLCQQLIAGNARTRLQRFEQFVQDDTQTRLRVARDRWQERTAPYSQRHPDSGTADSRLEDLAGNYPQLVTDGQTVVASIEASRKLVAAAVAEGHDLPTPVAAQELVERLTSAAHTARSAAESLGDPEALRTRLAAATASRKELELLREVKNARADILDEIVRRKARAALESLKNDAATGPITTKIAQLSEDHITEVVRDTFTRESDRLLLERVTVAKTRLERGTLMHQPKLVGARQNVALPRVFSEGERTALGLSAFFTEALLDASGSAVILDDPVSSLDHVRRGRVASRLAALAQTRQVIVFTHDVALVSDLKREAQGLSVGICERSVARHRGGEKKPGRTSGEHPWKAKDVGERLNELRTDVAHMKQEQATWDDKTHEETVAAWAGRLSETWERIFNQEILCQVLAEGGLEVRPKMVRILTKFGQSDEDEFQASYSRVSQWASRHDKSTLTNYVPPELGDLETELDRVEAWFKRIKRYRA